jgi:hypothetical protein
VNFFNGFTPAVGKSAQQRFGDKIRDIGMTDKTVPLDRLAEIVNPVIRGWANYFSRYNASGVCKALDRVNLTLAGYMGKLQEQSHKKKLCQGGQSLGRHIEKKPICSFTGKWG